MIQSYKKKYEIADQYDVIIVGSGPGGMSSGVMLAKEGYKVLILERHYVAGGYTHVFKRPGYEWDVGVHYIGEMGRKSFAKMVFDYATGNELKWADMGEVYDKVVIGDEAYEFVKGKKELMSKLKGYFPGEETAIDRYFELVSLAVRAGKNYYSEKAIKPWLSKLIGGYLRKDFLKFSRRTTLEVIQSLTSNERLIKVLTGQYGDYGLTPSKSSFAMHAALARHYFSGGYFPVGGSSRIADTINDEIEKHGGNILINADVSEIKIQGGKATGVKMADGKEFDAPIVISSIGYANTYQKLLPDSSVGSKIKRRLSKLNPSVSHVCLYVGLSGNPDELKLPKANYWVYPENGSHDEIVKNFTADISSDLPVVYISFPSAKDPAWPERYPGKSTIDIITMMPYEIFGKWSDTRWKKRGEEYDQLKESISKRLLAELYKREPQLEGKVDYYELSSPLSTQHFMNYDQGEIYGTEHVPERFDQQFLRPHTEIKGFYLTGQDIVTVGHAGAMASGVVTASAITGKNLIKKIMKG